MNKYRFSALIVGSSLAIAGTAFAGSDCDKSSARSGHGASQRFSQLDSNKDGKINLAELTASREGWLAQVDGNKDGVATQAEIDASHESGRKEHMDRMFARQDANKDGKLARDESRMPSAWFERADVNKDGALTVAELSAARKVATDKAPGAKDGRAGKGGKLARLDQNGDGKVEREELRSAAARQFSRLDQNSDGALTSEEFRASHGRGHGRHRNGPKDSGSETVAPKPMRS